MISRTTERFRRCLTGRPEAVRKQAGEAYKRFAADPNHPSLYFKRVHTTEPVYSVRVSLDYRALGVRDGQEMIWFWIGFHADYERRLAQW